MLRTEKWLGVFGTVRRIRLHKRGCWGVMEIDGGEACCVSPEIRPLFKVGDCV